MQKYNIYFRIACQILVFFLYFNCQAEAKSIYVEANRLISALNDRCKATYHGQYTSEICTRVGPRIATNYDYAVPPVNYVRLVQETVSDHLVVTGRYTQSWWEVTGPSSSNKVEKVYEQTDFDWWYSDNYFCPGGTTVLTQRVRGRYYTNLVGDADRAWLDTALLNEIDRKIVALTGVFIDPFQTEHSWLNEQTGTHFDYSWDSDRGRWYVVSCSPIQIYNSQRIYYMTLSNIFARSSIGKTVSFPVISDRGSSYPRISTNIVSGYKAGVYDQYSVTNTTVSQRYITNIITHSFWTYGDEGAYTNFTLARLYAMPDLDNNDYPRFITLAGFYPGDYNRIYPQPGRPGSQIQFTNGAWTVYSSGTQAVFRGETLFDTGGWGDFWFWFLSLKVSGCFSAMEPNHTGGVAYVSGKMVRDPYSEKIDHLEDGIYRTVMDHAYSDWLVVDFPTQRIASCENTNIIIDCETVRSAIGVITVSMTGWTTITNAVGGYERRMSNRVMQVYGCGDYEIPGSDFYEITSISASPSNVPALGLTIRVEGRVSGALYTRSQDISRNYSDKIIEERLKAITNFTHTIPGHYYTNVMFTEVSENEDATNPNSFYFRGIPSTYIDAPGIYNSLSVNYYEHIDWSSSDDTYYLERSSYYYLDGQEVRTNHPPISSGGSASGGNLKREVLVYGGSLAPRLIQTL